MADDPQRNFRSAYYEKVGFRGVEEKKSLEILLKDSPLGALASTQHHMHLCKVGPIFFRMNTVHYSGDITLECNAMIEPFPSANASFLSAPGGVD